MNSEEFEIVIKKSGEIVVKLDNLEKKRVRHYRELFEEAIGPTRDVVEIGDDGVPPGMVRYSDADKKKEEEKKEERLKH